MKLEFLKEKKKEILIGLAIIAIIIFSLISNFKTFTEEKKEEQDVFLDNEYNSYGEELVQRNNIYIHLDGAVKNSGLIELEEGDRLESAIKKAGGLLDTADLRYVNLAMVMIDGEKIYIPTNGELVDSASGVSYIPEVQESKKVSINRASLEELQKIPGVGVSTATNIINYRKKNGNFKKIEEIKNVTGIAEAKFESMLEYIEL